MITGVDAKKKVSKIKRRNISEIQQVHPVVYALLYASLDENGNKMYPDIIYELPLTNGNGRVDFVVTDSHGRLCVFECKNRIYNPMELNKAAAQAYTYKKALNADYVFLVVPEDNIYAEAYEDIKNVFVDCEIGILEVPILDRHDIKKVTKPNSTESKLVIDISDEA